MKAQKCLIVSQAMLVLLLVGCFWNDDNHVRGYVYTNRTILACEDGVIRTFHFIGLARATAGGDFMVLDEPDLRMFPPVTSETVNFPAVVPRVKPSLPVMNQIYYTAPDFRQPEQLISFIGAVNRELSPNHDCYLLSTNPLVIGFWERADIMKDEKNWLSTNPWSAPVFRYAELYASQIGGRTGRFISSSGENPNISAVAIYPRDITELKVGDIKQDAGRVELVTFSSPQPVSKILEAGCDLTKIPNVVGDRMTTRVRMLDQ